MRGQMIDNAEKIAKMLRMKILLLLPLIISVSGQQPNPGIGYFGSSNVRDQTRYPQPMYRPRPQPLPLPGRPQPIAPTIAPTAPMTDSVQPSYAPVPRPLLPPGQGRPAPTYVPQPPSPLPQPINDPVPPPPQVDPQPPQNAAVSQPPLAALESQPLPIAAAPIPERVAAVPQPPQTIPASPARLAPTPEPTLATAPSAPVLVVESTEPAPKPAPAEPALEANPTQPPLDSADIKPALEVNPPQPPQDNADIGPSVEATPEPEEKDVPSLPVTEDTPIPKPVLQPIVDPSRPEEQPEPVAVNQPLPLPGDLEPIMPEPVLITNQPPPVEVRPPGALPPLLPKPKPEREPVFGRHTQPVPEPTTYYPTTALPPVQYTTTPAPVRTTRQPVTQVPPKPIESLELNFVCQKQNGYYPVENQCDSYIHCKQGKAYRHSCPDGLHFNREAKRNEFPCSYPSEVKCGVGAQKQNPKPTEQCPRQYGFFPMNDGDCSKFIMCQEGTATIVDCPAGLVFNPEVSSCDWVANVPQCNPNVFRDYTCPAPPLDDNGLESDIIYKYKYGQECRLYIACQKGFPRLLSCERGQAFDHVSEACIDEDYVEACSEPVRVAY